MLLCSQFPDFLACLAFLFSMMDFAGFFLTSFLASLDFAISYLLYVAYVNRSNVKVPLFVMLSPI